jgi:hypothetical protein
MVAAAVAGPIATNWGTAVACATSSQERRSVPARRGVALEVASENGSQATQPLHYQSQRHLSAAVSRGRVRCPNSIGRWCGSGRGSDYRRLRSRNQGAAGVAPFESSTTHHRKTVDATSVRLQDRVLQQHMPLEYSAVAGPWSGNQRLELETDLIAAHILKLGSVPPAQFIGRGAPRAVSDD